jgi:hypothetical protein
MLRSVTQIGRSDRHNDTAPLRRYGAWLAYTAPIVAVSKTSRQ